MHRTNARAAGALLAVALASACGGAAAPPSPAVVTTRPPDGLTASGATLHGEASGAAAGDLAWFEWGSDPALAAALETARAPLPAGAGAVPFEATLDGLPAGATTWYRAVVASGGRTLRGAVERFGTPTGDPLLQVVNTAEDLAAPPPGQVSLRAALAAVEPGGTVRFDPSLDGATLRLTVVGEPHTVLRGEVWTFAAGAFTFQGFLPRDYGRSALYAAKSVTLDAGALPRGVALEWAGGEASPARVLAVLGDLTMENVTVRGGHARAEPLADPAQPYTLGRGGGLAVWGQATLRRCTVAGNRATGDATASRDRGAFGGGVYADGLVLEDSVVAGNAARGFGAAGGGVYSEGGAAGGWTRLVRSSVSGNRVTGQHAYGGGVYSDGGGPGSMLGLELENVTVARNVVEDDPDLAEDPRAQYYYRGGGVYMSNGWLSVVACTVAENRVSGVPATFRGKPNMGGGGIAATIGDAHVVESMRLRQSLVVGNTLAGAPSDLFTGSLVDFSSEGYNLVGRLDFSQMLVPIPWWQMLSRRHWPKAGDLDGVEAATALDLAGAVTEPAIASAGAGAGAPVVLWYPPAGPAVDRVPTMPWEASRTTAGYDVVGPVDDFLVRLVEKVRAHYGDQLGADFGAGLPDPTGVTFYGPAATWPSNPENGPWISFWRQLEAAIGDRLGATQLGDYFWASFASGALGDDLVMWVDHWAVGNLTGIDLDGLGTARPAGAGGDVGAVERLP